MSENADAGSCSRIIFEISPLEVRYPEVQPSESHNGIDITVLEPEECNRQDKKGAAVQPLKSLVVIVLASL